MRKRFLFLMFAMLVAIFLNSCSDVPEGAGASVSLDFRMRQPSGREAKGGSGVYSVVARLRGAEQTLKAQVSEGESARFEFDEVTVGQKVKVLVSVLEDDELVYFGSSKEFSVSPGNNEALVVLHTARLYVGEGGSDSNPGTKDAPLATLGGAFERIAQTPDEDAEWVVRVSGKIEGNTKIANPGAKSVTLMLGGNLRIAGDFSAEGIAIDGRWKYGVEITADTVSFKDCAFKNGSGTNSSGQPFGMVYWNGSKSAKFYGCSFTGCKTYGDIGGGAAALFGGGTVEFNGCAFSENSADHGAAIDIGGEDSVSVVNCVFSGNNANNDCDIYLGGSASSITGSGNKSDYSTPYRCYSTEKACPGLFSETGSRNGGGHSGGGSGSGYIDAATWSEAAFLAAVENASETEYTITLLGNVRLTNNFSTEEYLTIDGQGKYGIEIAADTVSFKHVTFLNGAGTTSSGQPFGMIYWNGSTSATFDSCTFDGCKTYGDVGGGAAALFGSGAVEFSGCTFNGNIADHGAAIDIGGGDSVTVTDCIFSENSANNDCDIFLGGSASSITGSGNESDYSTPYRCYSDEKACPGLFSETGSR